MLLAALGQEAADPQRRAGLQQAIQEDHDGSVVDNLPAYLNGEMSGKATNGQGIVNHVLGDRREPAAQALAGKSGLNMGTIMSLLPLLAPIVMGMLGKKERSGGLSLDNLADALVAIRGAPRMTHRTSVTCSAASWAVARAEGRRDRRYWRSGQAVTIRSPASAAHPASFDREVVSHWLIRPTS